MGLLMVHFCDQIYRYRSGSKLEFNKLFVDTNGCISLGEKDSSHEELYKVNQKIIEYTALMRDPAFNQVKQELHNNGIDRSRRLIYNLSSANYFISTKNHSFLYRTALKIINFVKTFVRMKEIPDYYCENLPIFLGCLKLLSDSERLHETAFGWREDLDRSRCRPFNVNVRTSDGSPLPEALTSENLCKLKLNLIDSIPIDFDGKAFTIYCNELNNFCLSYRSSEPEEIVTKTIEDSFFSRTTEERTNFLPVKIQIKGSSQDSEEVLTRSSVSVSKKGKYFFGEDHTTFYNEGKFYLELNKKCRIFGDNGNRLTFTINESRSLRERLAFR
jgi:hypothetical protein